METRYYYMVDIQNPYCAPRLVYKDDPGLANISLDIEEGQALIVVEGEKLEDPGRITVREVSIKDGKVDNLPKPHGSGRGVSLCLQLGIRSSLFSAFYLYLFQNRE